jgi:hypothetical protein
VPKVYAFLIFTRFKCSLDELDLVTPCTFFEEVL